MVDVSLPAAALGGLVSFLSPCVLPLVPPYLSFLAGTTFDRLQAGDDACHTLDRDGSPRFDPALENELSEFSEDLVLNRRSWDRRIYDVLLHTRQRHEAVPILVRRACPPFL